MVCTLKISRVIWFFQLAHAYMGHAIMDPRVTVNVSRVTVKRFQFFEDQWNMVEKIVISFLCPAMAVSIPRDVTSMRPASDKEWRSGTEVSLCYWYKNKMMNKWSVWSLILNHILVKYKYMRYVVSDNIICNCQSAKNTLNERNAI